RADAAAQRRPAAGRHRDRPHRAQQERHRWIGGPLPRVFKRLHVHPAPARPPTHCSRSFLVSASLCVLRRPPLERTERRSITKGKGGDCAGKQLPAADKKKYIYCVLSGEGGGLIKYIRYVVY
uniref:Uncharacterized protein n=1 Tax=Gasterosteus aculeatus TaxID=69293 RepID=G3NND4_GASAC